MGVEEIIARQWTCDQCGRMDVIPGDDEDPPYHWEIDCVLAFCGFSCKTAWRKLQEKLELC